jgi:hypothetical protein
MHLDPPPFTVQREMHVTTKMTPPRPLSARRSLWSS